MPARWEFWRTNPPLSSLKPILSTGRFCTSSCTWKWHSLINQWLLCTHTCIADLLPQSPDIFLYVQMWYQRGNEKNSSDASLDCLTTKSILKPFLLADLVLVITTNDMEVVRKLLKVLTCNGSRTIDNFVRFLTGPSKPINFYLCIGICVFLYWYLYICVFV